MIFKQNKKILYIVLIILIIIISNYISISVVNELNSIKGDTDYKNIGLDLENNDIKYCTQYGYARINKYKVYSINKNSMKEVMERLKTNKLWNRNKYYEYIMKEFYEIKGQDKINIDRDDLYYYNNTKGIYAVLDKKNAKLYYYENGLFNYHSNYSEVLGIKVKDFTTREIYSVRGGPQNDGTDYYIYEFTEEKGKEIIKTLEKNPKWRKNRLEDEKLDDFKYNEEVLTIKNGYYHYEKVCRTSDENKKHNFTDEEATGWEIGVYDVDRNMLYYYWTSY